MYFLSIFSRSQEVCWSIVPIWAGPFIHDRGLLSNVPVNVGCPGCFSCSQLQLCYKLLLHDFVTRLHVRQIHLQAPPTTCSHLQPLQPPPTTCILSCASNDLSHLRPFLDHLESWKIMKIIKNQPNPKILKMAILNSTGAIKIDLQNTFRSRLGLRDPKGEIKGG